MKYLYPYECEKKNLSTPGELQAAIDGNRREGRRSSYGPYDGMQNQLQLPQVQRPPVPNSMQQMSPLALVAHGNAPSAHHRMLAPHLNQMGITQHEIEQRMMEYIKFFQPLKDAHAAQTPNLEALNALEMSRVALWSLYGNNTSPPASNNTSPQGPIEPQREALNLSESPPSVNIKRERDHPEPESPSVDRERDFAHPPPAKSFRGPFHMSHPDDRDADLSADEHAPGLVNSRVQYDEHHHHETNISNKPSVSPPPHAPNGVSESCDFPLLTGMQFKLARRGNSANGEQQLVVNLEVNGVHYEGVLFANPSARSSPSANTSKASTTDANSSIDERTHSLVSS
ncbi:unnamed protein product [Hermetia illucens]|nr:unnamed protein product [Hermetia illucens]